MSKDELLNLLDDKDVRRKIFKIIGASNDELEEKISALEKENFRLQNELHTLEEKNSALNQFDSLRKENFYLKNTLSKAQQQNKNLQSDLENYQRELDVAQNKISRLRNSVDELHAQLENNFGRGRELFQNYQRVGANTRQLLKGVFPREDFMSFICGGAQTNSLETLWDVLRDCIMSGNRQDSEILREIFEYCLELVNSSKVKASYSILPVKVGDRFDSDFHTEAPNSRAQGKISAVYLPGYKNDYNGCIIKKSIVQVS